MDTHRSKENHDAHDVWNLLWIWIDSDDDMEEEEARQEEVNIHKEMASM